jgi:hypothetical protein
MPRYTKARHEIELTDVLTDTSLCVGSCSFYDIIDTKDSSINVFLEDILGEEWPGK